MTILPIASVPPSEGAARKLKTRPTRHSVELNTRQGESNTKPCCSLLVDDNRDAATSLGMILKFLGADVHLAHDGPSALAALVSYRPSIVLLDIGMPEMDGYEVARRARQLPEGQEAILIALTGWGQEEDRRRSMEAGFDYHLVKPVEHTTLQTLLSSLPEKKW